MWEKVFSLENDHEVSCLRVLVFKISSHEVRAKHKEAIGILPCAQFRKFSVFPLSFEDFAVPRQKEDTFAYHPAYKRPTDKSPGGDMAWGLKFLRKSRWSIRCDSVKAAGLKLLTILRCL